MALKKEKTKKTRTKREKPVLKMRRLHDETVKEYLSDHSTAKSFFKEYLPAPVVKNLDFRTLKICKDSFISKKLVKYFSDILYQVHLKGVSIFIYLLIDHKSKVEPFIGFQFLKYLVRIWELYLKQNSNARTLPVVIPMAIYHGPLEWKVDTRFIALFDAPGYLKEYIPDFGYKLIDISHVPDEDIKGEVLLRILLMTLKYVFTPGLWPKLKEEIFPLFLKLKDKRKGTEYLEVLLGYLAGNAGSLPEDELNESVSQLFEEGGDSMATLAEKWKREGKKEGKIEGNIEAKWDVVKIAMEEGLPLKTIERLTGLPLEEINRFKETHSHHG
jgi:predicted transposase/invertase (TIGR01784 family)